MPASGTELSDVIFTSMLVPYHTDFSTREYGWPNNIQSSAPLCHGTWSCILEKSLPLIHVFLRHIGVFA
jgi:hypothetical protein